MNEDCLRHIGQFLSIEDKYSLGHTCTQLFEMVSKFHASVTIENLNDLQNLNYFGTAATRITVLFKDNVNQFTEEGEKKLLSIMEKKCRKISALNLFNLNSRILSSKYFEQSAGKLQRLMIDVSELTRVCWPQFIKSMRKCKSLKVLSIFYRQPLIDTTNELTKFLATMEFPELEDFRFYDNDFQNSDDEYVAPPNSVLCRNYRQLKFFRTSGSLVEENFDSVALCSHLELFTLIVQKEKHLTPKLLALNKMPELKYTSLVILPSVNEQMTPILQQIQSLRDLYICCTLFEDFIQDIFKIPQITSLRLEIFENDDFDNFDGSKETFKRLRYYEQSLSKLTELDLFDIEVIVPFTSSELTEFVKFIINCPKIQWIILPKIFPINRFYKLLMKHKKSFGYHTRKNALHLAIQWNQWIPAYSDGRRTINIIIQDKNGNEPDKSIHSITCFILYELYAEIDSVFCLFIFVLFGTIIRIIQDVIICYF